MFQKFSLKNLTAFLNIFAIPFTFTIFVLFLTGISGVFNNNYQTSIIYLLVSLVFNYLITLLVTIYLISTSKKSNLFVNFYLFLFLFLPFVGIFLYFLLGTSLLNFNHARKYIEKFKRYQKYENYEYSEALKKTFDQNQPNKTLLYNYIKNQTPIYKNNYFKLLSDPSQILLEMVRLIKLAKKFIHLEYYIFSDGLVLNYLLDLLEAKAKEGVEVRLIVDYTANFRRLSRKTRKRIVKAGIYLKIFNPFFRFSGMWWQFRDHNKLVVVDNKYGIYGSCNLSDESFNISDYYFQSTELCVSIEGPVVNSLNVLFCLHWQMSWKKYLLHEEQSIHLDTSNYLKITPSKKSNTVAQFLSSAPLSNHPTIKENLVHLIFNAKKSIIISTPYFYPPYEIINALKQASVLGIKIKIIVPNQSDLKNFLRHLNMQLFLDLLPDNIEIYEYYGFNHEKLMLIDDETIYFGSYNWDYRALYLNFEGALLIKSLELANSMRKFVEKQLSNSQRIFYDDVLSHKKFKFTIFNTIIRIFKPFL